MTLALLGNTLLRAAITRNLVSFPAQIQPFMRRSSGDLQERIVMLYFVRGWSVRMICERYSLSKAMAHKLLAEWRIRAVESGYIQEIKPGGLEELASEATAEATAEEKEEAAVAETAQAMADATFTLAGDLSLAGVQRVSRPAVHDSRGSAGGGL
jgi:transposase-like protein